MSGLMATIFPPFSTHFSSDASILGWLVPGFWPAMMMVSAS